MSCFSGNHTITWLTDKEQSGNWKSGSGYLVIQWSQYFIICPSAELAIKEETLFEKNVATLFNGIWLYNTQRLRNLFGFNELSANYGRDEKTLLSTAYRLDAIMILLSG